MKESSIPLSYPDIEMPDGSEDEYQVIEDYLFPDDMNTDNQESASHPESIMPVLKQLFASISIPTAHFLELEIKEIKDLRNGMTKMKSGSM